ncbi:MAG: ATP synthase F0 subunit B [Flavobacteriales bacterium]|nr:ATP synthase F0 subunit B [Flavobacteriales bacterium]|tara:strand:- start:822 stop:1310 length:489 start_codon:yes stop_codon:yes gene_type:complete
MISFDPGLIIWTTIIFTLLLIVLKKFAWKPILKAVDERNLSIEEALKAAEKAKKEMEKLNADNERILDEAKLERDALLKEARDIKERVIVEAKEKANVEADKIITSARKQIVNEKMKAVTELKNSVAVLSIDIAERVLKSELKDKQTQEEFISKVLKSSELN